MTAKTIVVIGTGYVGLPAALMWAKAQQTVIGVDIDANVVRAINDGTMRLNEKEVRALFNDPAIKKNLVARPTPCAGDVFVIAVPTPVDPLTQDMRPARGCRRGRVDRPASCARAIWSSSKAPCRR